MIANRKRLIGSIYHQGRAIKLILNKNRELWEESTGTLSCYANGYWIDEYPWTDDTSWTD